MGAGLRLPGALPADPQKRVQWVKQSTLPAAATVSAMANSLDRLSAIQTRAEYSLLKPLTKRVSAPGQRTSISQSFSVSCRILSKIWSDASISGDMR